MSHFNIRMCQYNSELSLLAHAHSHLEVSDLVLVFREFDKLLINSKYAEITTISSAEKKFQQKVLQSILSQLKALILQYFSVSLDIWGNY